MHRQPESLHWISGYPAPKLRKDCIMRTEYSMNAKERKKYYFRAFDIATIYTFLKSHPCSELSSEEIGVLTSFKTDFDDMSEKRRNLLRKLKLQTLCLIQNRSI